PNGAGKTTLVEIIEEIIPPTSGRVLYKGRPRSSGFREQIGIMFQQTSLLAYTTVYETLAAFQALYHSSLDLEELVRVCHLEDICNQYNDKISGGQRQRLLLALALINRPELIFLDEPSTGLDPQARRNLWDIVADVKQQGKTIILTTHYMEEAQQLCDIVAIMDKGQIVAQGSPDRLIAEHTHGTNIVLPSADMAGAMEKLPMPCRLEEEYAIISVNEINTTIAALLAQGIDLSRMQIRTATLETVFLNLTGRQLRD
ncbi:MAG: ABC transporter ATP-binding protein, partial [Desulfatitalea sp.]|nr:ABC transporter ATP-binding protein [Desulfatitalea sp.]